MADPTNVPPAQPVTAESLLADRQSFLAGFWNATTWAVAGVATLLVLMALFLV